MSLPTAEALAQWRQDLVGNVRRWRNNTASNIIRRSI